MVLRMMLVPSLPSNVAPPLSSRAVATRFVAVVLGPSGTPSLNSSIEVTREVGV